MKKAAFLFFRVEVGNAACAVQYLVVVQTMLVRCPKNLDFTVFQKVSLSNLIFIEGAYTEIKLAYQKDTENKLHSTLKTEEDALIRYNALCTESMTESTSV